MNNNYPGRQWTDRLKMWAGEFPKHYMETAETIELYGFTTYERLSLTQAAEKKESCGQAFPVGTEWGKFWEYGWFFTEFTVPEALKGKRLVFQCGAGEEMLVWVNGVERGAIDKQHDAITLTESAAVGEHFAITAECYAGHGPRMEGGCFCPKGEKPFSDEDREQLTVGSSRIAVWQEDIFQTAMDYLALYSLLQKLPPKSLRRIKVTEGLKKFTTMVDFEQTGEVLRSQLTEADGILKELLSCRNGSTAPEFTIFGQSHLDLAWLWTEEETRRKAARTYGNQLALMEEYPEYRFLLCEPPILEYLKESYPKLWQRVKEKAAEGQIYADGALYVECDTNIPCGESLVRQFLYGKEWFQEELGADCKMVWLPDSFGFTPSLPQIMKQCETPYFATQKLIRQDPECEPFPYNDFWWEGIDGSRVLAHTYKENNARICPADLITRWENDRVQEEGMEGMMYPFGYGDGGGGPTRQLVEMAKRCEDLEGAPRTRYEHPAAYFERMEKRNPSQIFSGELYLAWHRGTYTAQAKTKRGMRRAEFLMKETEYWNTVLAAADSCREKSGLSEQETPLWDARKGHEVIKALWKCLLFQQFHDILPGTGIARVHREAEEELTRIAESCEDILRKIFGELKKMPSWNSPESEKTQAAKERQKASVQIETGYDSVTKRPYLRSRYLYAEMDEAGRIVKLTTEADGNDYAALGQPMNSFRLYRNVNSYYDAWEIGSMYEEEEEEINTSGWKLTLEEYQGIPAWKLEGQIKASPFTQWIHISEDGKMIEFHLQIDWQERHKMLKVDFPSSVRSNEVISEVAFGNYKRPVTNSYQWEKDRYEMSGHHYSALGNGRYGIALINDCKYGFSAKQDRISLTLLRSPLMPDMYADRGIQKMSFACCPYGESLRKAGVAQRAGAFNRRQHIPAELRREAEENAFRFPLFRLEDVEEGAVCSVLPEAVKLAEDGSGNIILRLYEAYGYPVRARLVPGFLADSAEETSLLEKAGSHISDELLTFSPYEIKTLRIRV